MTLEIRRLHGKPCWASYVVVAVVAPAVSTATAMEMEMDVSCNDDATSVTIGDSHRQLGINSLFTR